MIVVPSAQPVSVCETASPASTVSSEPKLAPCVLDIMRIFDTDAIAASASPRKPSVIIASRSDASAILLVAWRRIAFGMSSGSIPQPSSVTRMKDEPPFFISAVMFFAPASSEFSISSLTADDGRSTTSPAAMRLATSKPSMLILPIISAAF